MVPLVDETGYISRRYDDLAVCIHFDIANNRGLFCYYTEWLEEMMCKHNLPVEYRARHSLVAKDSHGRSIGCSGAVENNLVYYNPMPSGPREESQFREAERKSRLLKGMVRLKTCKDTKGAKNGANIEIIPEATYQTEKVVIEVKSAEEDHDLSSAIYHSAAASPQDKSSHIIALEVPTINPKRSKSEVDRQSLSDDVFEETVTHQQLFAEEIKEDNLQFGNLLAKKKEDEESSVQQHNEQETVGNDEQETVVGTEEELEFQETCSQQDSQQETSEETFKEQDFDQLTPTIGGNFKQEHAQQFLQESVTSHCDAQVQLDKTGEESNTADNHLNKGVNEGGSETALIEMKPDKTTRTKSKFCTIL